jgi:hypothetical protein
MDVMNAGTGSLAFLTSITSITLITYITSTLTGTPPLAPAF